jgi:tRNA-Thr(GGU) m(6)t(6)A37 methyltransferase TsaA
MTEFMVRPIGYIRSELKDTAQAPRFYTEGAPDAWLELDPSYHAGLERLEVGQELILITWLHLAQRNVLQVHPRGDPANPLTGVFLTRSPDRPNPLGLHRAWVRAVDGNRLRVGPIEAIDGTPVVDLKSVVAEAQDY